MPARDSRRLSVIRPKARASSPTSSFDVTAIGWSSSPPPTTAMPLPNSMIGRAMPRAMSHDANVPRPNASTRIAISTRSSPVRMSSSRAYAPRTLDSRARRYTSRFTSVSAGSSWSRSCTRASPYASA